MTVLYINVVKDDCQVWELIKGRYFDLSDFNGSANIFVGFNNKLLNDSVFKDEYGRYETADQHEKHQQSVENDFFENLQ